MSDLQFGIFDHMDSANVAPVQLFRDRLRLIDAYEQAGFYSYHLAEHHSTPLGLAPSPGVFLAAVAERTEAVALVRWSTCCRSITRCGSRRR